MGVDKAVPNQDLVFNILARDRNAKRTFKEVGDAAEKASQKIGGLNFDSVLRSAVSTPQAAAATAGAAVGASALVANVMTSGILASLGGGALAAGIALAMRDPALTKAAKGLGSNILADLTEATKGFQAPIQRGFETLGGTWQSILPGIKDTFAILAPYVDKLTVGIDGFIRNVMPGIEAGIRDARPILDAIINAMPMLGSAIGDFFKIISQDSDRTSSNLEAFFSFLAGAIRTAGFLINGLTMAWNFFVDHMLSSLVKLSDFGEGAFGWIPGVGDKLKSFQDTAHRALEDYRNGAGNASKATRDLNDQVSGLPGDKKIGVWVEAGAAGRTVEQFGSRLNSLQDKTVTLNLRVNESRTQRQILEQIRMGAFRMGGITPIHAQRGLMSQANMYSGGPPLYAFAEPGTGQEAFIPKNGDMGRSRSLARRVVDDWLGGPDKIWGGRGGGGVYNINVTVAPGVNASQAGAAAGAEVVRVLKEYERTNGTSWRS